MQDGDVLRFDYTLTIQGHDKPLETSLEDVAREHGIAEQGKVYQPLVITLGRRMVLPALEEAIKSAKPGQSLGVDLPAAKAYGERDPAKLKDIPMAHFRKQKVQPQVGMQLNMEGGRATIVRVAGGRVRVDMNHDLAGQDLHYDVIVRDVITDGPAKVDAVLGGMFREAPKTEFSEDKVVIEVPDQAKFDRDWPMHKFRVVSEVRSAVGADKAIVLQETFPAMPAHDEEE